MKILIKIYWNQAITATDGEFKKNNYIISNIYLNLINGHMILNTIK